MILAGLYAARHWIDLPRLSVPWMRGVHGGLNALGFGLGGAVFVAARESLARRAGPSDPPG